MFSITRDGKEYNLTKSELFKAYVEQQHQFDVEYIIEILEDVMSENHPDIVEDAAWLYRDLLDKAYEAQDYCTKKVNEFVAERLKN